MGIVVLDSRGEFGGNVPDRRSAARVQWFSRTILCCTTPFNDPLCASESIALEVGTNDVSATGVRIIGPMFLRIGQRVCVRMGGLSGLSISAHGRVARCIPRERQEANTKGDWAIAFSEEDSRVLRGNRIFAVPSGLISISASTTAVLISSHPLELFWWFSRLPSRVRVVYVATSEETILEQMRAMSPGRTVRRWPESEPSVIHRES